MSPELVERVAEQVAAMMLQTKPATNIARWALALAERAAREALLDGGRSIYRTTDQDIEAAVQRAVEGCATAPRRQGEAPRA